MGVLDDFFLGRNRERRQLASSQLEDLRNAKVLALTERGALIETADRRASTMGAATALLRTTGGLPEGFFTKASRESLVAFRGDTGKETAGLLASRGIGKGSTVSDLAGALGSGGEAASSSRKIAEEIDLYLKENRKNGRANASSTGSRFGGSTSPFSSGQSNPTQSFQKGYGLVNLNNDNEDINDLGKFLENLFPSTRRY